AEPLETRLNGDSVQRRIARLAGAVEMMEGRIDVPQSRVEHREVKRRHKPALLHADQVGGDRFGGCPAARNRKRVTHPRLRHGILTLSFMRREQVERFIELALLNEAGG